MIKVRASFLNFSSLRLISTSCVLRKDNDDKKADAVSKLNALLADLSTQKPQEKSATKLNLAKPQQLKSKKEKKDGPKKEKEPADLAGKLKVAASKVADNYGGDKQKTESELLNLLLAYQKDPSGESPSTSKPALSDLISGMKVERKPRQDDGQRSASSEIFEGRAGEVRKALAGKRPLRQPRQSFEKTPQKVDLWGESGLGIFDTTKLSEFSEGPRLTTWSKLHMNDLKLSITHPPSNIYEQMILWTEQGKLWHFPINNEQGLDKESNVDFTEHVMLNHYLEPWCPKKGPIRTFMDLMLVGLSKNPYYTVEEKVEHIHWFRDYFAYKNAILKSLEIPEIPDGNPEFRLHVDVDFKRWGEEINSPRKY